MAKQLKAKRTRKTASAAKRARRTARPSARARGTVRANSAAKPARAPKAPRKAAKRSAAPRAPQRAIRMASAAPAADVLDVTFELRDAARQLITDPETRFTFRQLSGNRQIGNQVKAAPLRATPKTFALPALVGDAVVCEIDPVRYRFARSPIFFRTPGPSITRTSILFREPDAWTPVFTAWAALGPSFAHLQQVLSASADVIVFRKGLPDSAPIPDRLVAVSAAEYDAIDGALVPAKTALLNIHHPLRTTMEPVSGTRSWFSFVQRLVATGRERFLAFVDPEMETLVRQISDHIDDFRASYERTPAENHRGNVPADLQPRITAMVSIKSTHKRGNFQLTLTHLSGQHGGSDEVLLDADIDESGTLVGHLFDLVKHKLSGGTHPVDIHEILTYLHHEDPTLGPLDLGYVLR